ncbi:MAG: hypothetical protein H6922_05650 [Pseudomonadaceae bacterium]|nr:hypothetical protein [Pseudomonadaceae bacterium]
MIFQNRAKALKDTAGYTIDQTILIVAIIAILVTLIIITVGWQLINRTSGTKLASQFKQIEDANGQFYASFRVWPDEAYSAPAVSADANMQALAGVAGTWNAAVPAAKIRNFVPGFRLVGTTLEHNFSSGGTVGMERVTSTNMVSWFGLQGEHFVVMFADVPFSEVQEAEDAIDSGGDDTLRDYASGRVVASTANCLTAVASGVTASTSPGSLVNVCYAANLTQ